MKTFSGFEYYNIVEWNIIMHIYIYNMYCLKQRNNYLKVI